MRTLTLLPAGAILALALAVPAPAQSSPSPQQPQPSQPSAKAPRRPATPSTVMVITNAEVQEAFKTGVGMLQSDDYKVNAGRRDVVGEAELHGRETDFFYVVEGSATIITGGTIQNQKTVSPGEIRGSGITGGERHTLSKGDVIVIPHGVPHWFDKITQGPFLYFVVKSITP